MRRIFAGTCTAAALAAFCLPLQAAGPTPVQMCEFSGGDFLSSGRKSHGYEVDRLARELPAVLDWCRKAVESEPKAAELHAKLARVLAVAGDDAEALKEARRGTELGSSMAAVLLGVMYADGRGVARDYGAALKLFRDPAQRDHALAHFNLGVMLANGWGVALDDAEAVAQFHQAAGGFDPLAMQILGDSYAKGRGVVADPATAERWWRQAVERGQAGPEGRRNPFRIAPLGRAAPDAAALVAWYERQARAGELWAQTYVGALYEAGQWVRQDYPTAIEWYRKAGEAGHVPAQMRMAALYSDGRGVARDRAEMLHWARMGMDQKCDRDAQSEPGANECDRLAADTYDPGKVVPGLSGYCMSRYAAKAIPACRRATSEFPATLRYRAQLARALAHAGRFEEARREARSAAAQGSTLAMTLLGMMDERGYGAAKNESEALAWYRKAADLDDRRAIQLVTMKANDGMGVAKGSPEAKALADAMSARMWKSLSPGAAAQSIDSQAERGDPRAQHNLASQLEQQKKYDEAVKWYTRAAEQGFGPSQLNLAQMYERGIGVTKNPAEAAKWYRKSAERGDGEALYQLALLQVGAANYAEAARHFRRGVEHDDYRAMLGLGELYEQGKGVKRDAAQAVQLYERAAGRSRWAQFKLGVMYSQGQGVPKSDAKALAWWQKAADGGDGRAQNNLGWMVEHGIGVRRDDHRALDWYLAAHQRGIPQAKGNLEKLFEEGRGAPIDSSAAIAWYRSGAEAGIAAAQYPLGMFYLKGEALAPSETEAEKWLVAAAQQGHGKARTALGELYFSRAQRVERGEGGAPDHNAARGLYMQAAAFGNTRAADHVVAELERAGDRAAAAQLRALIERGYRVPPSETWPTGLVLDPGKDEQRAIRLRISGVAQAQAAMVAGDAFEVIFWVPPAKPAN